MTSRRLAPHRELRAAIALTLYLAARGEAAPIQGYGAVTTGGAVGTIVHVTTLRDSGDGSLRQALGRGNRRIVFDVGGTIDLRKELVVRGSYVTLDGTSAPSPGITLRQAGIVISGSGAHDVIVRGIRIRNPGVNYKGGDGITIKNGAYNIVIDHVSVDGCGDGSIDITRRARDVTVQWSILSGCAKNMLIKYEATRLSVHHNLFIEGHWRNPNVAYTDERTPNTSPDTTADVRNNLVWHWGDSGGGTILQCGAKVNLVGNFYSSPGTSPLKQGRAIVDDGCHVGSHALVYAAGNVSADRLMFDLNRISNQSAPFAAARVDTVDACRAAHEVVAGAGARPLDAVDQRYVATISLAPCGVSNATAR